MADGISDIIFDILDIFIYLLTATVLTPGGSSTVHIYTKQNIQNDTKQYIELHKNFEKVPAVPRLCGFYPGICLTTEGKRTEKSQSG